MALARFASMALQSITSPWTVGEDSVITQKGLSYVIGKTVKNLQIFALNNAGQIAAKNLDSTQASELTYRYCEIHPADNDWCYYTNEYNSIDWAILRRVVSSAQFVKAACPVIKTYAAWDLQWKIKDEKVRLEVEKFIEEFYRMLDFIYADGTWTLSRIDSYKGDFDPGFFRTLVRRYMDGGPEFIEELKNCTNERFFTSSCGICGLNRHLDKWLQLSNGRWTWRKSFRKAVRLALLSTHGNHKT